MPFGTRYDAGWYRICYRIPKGMLVLRQLSTSHFAIPTALLYGWLPLSSPRHGASLHRLLQSSPDMGLRFLPGNALNIPLIARGLYEIQCFCTLLYFWVHQHLVPLQRACALRRFSGNTEITISIITWYEINAEYSTPPNPL